MIKRIFLAVNLPEAAKQELASYREKWPELPARWTKPENLHLTLVFYGNSSEAELLEIIGKTKEIVQQHKPFSVMLSKIVYGPNPSQARMIWATGETSQELLKLQKELSEKLDRVEIRPFTLHLTLARFNEWQFNQIEPEERPSVNEDIHIEFPVNSIDIMESKLKRSGAEYTICESISLA